MRSNTLTRVSNNPGAVHQIIKPSEAPQQSFVLLKVSYDGKCEVEKKREGKRIREKSMYCVKTGQIVFSTIRATDGAIGIVPEEFDGALVSSTSYTIFDCEAPYEAAYLWSVLRSYELRADMQSLSPGSGRYTTYWPDVGQLLVPWPSRQQRKKIGQGLLELWDEERNLERKRKEKMQHLDQFGVESEASQKRWTDSKAPQ